MQHPDEGLIHAWLDGALSAEEAAAIESHVSECAECGAITAEARGLIVRSSQIVSALDSIPAGVIPFNARRPRAWYASAQFRAAAAVLVVAAGTLLVVRSRPGDVVQEKQAVTTAAPGAMPGELKGIASASKSPVIASAPAAAPSARKMKEAGDVASQVERQAIALDLSKKVSESDQAAGASRSSAAMANAPVREESLVLKEIKSDTTAGVVTTVYEVSPGVQVTLTEVSEAQFAPMASRKLASPRAAAAPAPPPVALGQAKPAVDSVTWTDSRGRPQKLVGPVPRETLEAIRKLLTPDKR